jgi:ribosome-binding factor A
MRTKGDGSRPARLGERIREELMDMLLRGAVKDPGASGAIVHAVHVTGDLRIARVYVRLGVPDASDAQRRALVKALERAAGFLRRELGPRLSVRHTPELQFLWDETAERALRVEELLGEIKREGES